MPAIQQYRFGDFILEASKQRVRHRDGQALDLTPRLFAALRFFVEHADELLDRDTLVAALWPKVVVEENNLSQVISGLRRALGDESRSPCYIETVPRRGFRFVAQVTAVVADGSAVEQFPPSLAASRRTREGTTVAVLPFVPLLREASDELLELGMADSLISRLSTVNGLVVRSVSSMRRFAGPDRDPMAAARALNVSWVVDGSLHRGSDRLRVTARLISAADGAAVWSGQFDEKFTDLFEVQDLISERVARALEPKLSANFDSSRESAAPASRSPTETGGTRDVDAYQLYLAARQHAQGVRAEGLHKSLELYDKALAIDAGYALAWAGQGETYRRMLFGADRAPSEVFAPYRKAVLRALELAPDLAEAHAQMGWIHFWHDFNWQAAELKFQHALRLNPNVVGAHFGLGFLLLTLDRIDEGIAHVRWARELDPMSLIINTMEASFLFAMGRRDEAAARLARAFEIEPNFWVAHLSLAVQHIADNKLEEAIVSLQRADALADQSSQPAALLGVCFAREGKIEESRAVLLRLQRLSDERYVPPTALAAVHAALGEAGHALDALERAYLAHDTRIAYIKDDMRWHALRNEPRFSALLHKMNLVAFGPGASGP